MSLSRHQFWVWGEPGSRAGAFRGVGYLCRAADPWRGKLASLGCPSVLCESQPSSEAASGCVALCTASCPRGVAALPLGRFQCVSECCIVVPHSHPETQWHNVRRTYSDVHGLHARVSWAALHPPWVAFLVSAPCFRSGPSPQKPLGRFLYGHVIGTRRCTPRHLLLPPPLTSYCPKQVTQPSPTPLEYASQGQVWGGKNFFAPIHMTTNPSSSPVWQFTGARSF